MHPRDWSSLLAYLPPSSEIPVNMPPWHFVAMCQLGNWTGSSQISGVDTLPTFCYFSRVQERASPRPLPARLMVLCPNGFT